MINPSSTYSNNLKFYIYNNNSQIKDYNDIIKIVYSPGNIQTVTLTPSNQLCGEIGNLSISFKPNNPILRNGFIRITLPLFNQDSGSTIPIELTTDKTTLTITSVYHINIGN